MNEDAPSKARMRSPAYPVISLEKAVEACRKIWDSQRKSDAHVDSVLKALGLGKHGLSMRIIAALAHFGLTTESGSKDDRRIKLSERAQDILHLGNDDPRRKEALKAAALSPAIHSALWERYGHILPDDSAMRPFLVRDKGFNDSSVADVIDNYRTSFEFAKLDINDDTSEDELSKKTEDIPEGPGAVARAKDIFTPVAPMKSGQMSELPILVGNSGIAKIPFPMSEDDFELLIGTLTLWKKKIVSSLSGGMRYPVGAVWKNQDFDKPVTIVAEMGERDGVRYFQSQDGTGIPENELTFA